MPVKINIDKAQNGSVQFETVFAAFSDTVFWMNNDPTAPHFPCVKMTLTPTGAGAFGELGVLGRRANCAIYSHLRVLSCGA